MPQTLVRAVVRGIDIARKTTEWLPSESPDIQKLLNEILPRVGVNYTVVWEKCESVTPMVKPQFQRDYAALLSTWGRDNAQKAQEIGESIDELLTLAGPGSIRREFQTEYDMLAMASNLAAGKGIRHDSNLAVALEQAIGELLADAGSAGKEVKEWNRSTSAGATAGG